MRLLSPKNLSAAMRGLLAGGHKMPDVASRSRAKSNTDLRAGPSAIAMGRELESFRRAQGTPYWHHDRRAG
jgi:hypothetical protein